MNGIKNADDNANAGAMVTMLCGTSMPFTMLMGNFPCDLRELDADANAHGAGNANGNAHADANE